MTQFSILTDEFIREAANSGAFARLAALAAGQTVVFIDSSGRYVEEYPGGTRFEIQLDPAQPRETHRKILRQLTSSAA